MSNYIVTGRVVERITRRGLAGLRVEAWDKDLLLDDLLDVGVTGSSGSFLLRFDESRFRELFLDRRPDLFFKVFSGDQLLASTEDSVLWNADRSDITTEIEVDAPAGTDVDAGATDTDGSRGRNIATRGSLQATYTPLGFKGKGAAPRGLEKAALFSHLSPSAEELSRLLSEYSAGKSVGDKRLVSAIAALQSGLSSRAQFRPLLGAAFLATIDAADLQAVARALVASRLEELQSQRKHIEGDDGAKPTGALLALADRLGLSTIGRSSSELLLDASTQLERLDDLARNVRKSLEETEPAGCLHLEKLEFTPAGIERGELVYSLPLAPGEVVNIAHKEWASTSEEFERIVTDYLEEYSEEGVTEKSELAQSVNSQNQHSTAFNTGVTASGEYGPVSITATVNYSVNDSATKSEQVTRNHASEITNKASSRAKREHKVSFKVASAAGTEDQSVRLIKNPFADRATRVDYYQLIRKWRVDLLRYGARLTWDIAIPEPGSGLLSKLAQLAELRRELEGDFSEEFTLKPGDIDFDPASDNHYAKVAARYAVPLAPSDIPPPLPRRMSVGTDPTKDWSDDGSDIGGFDTFRFSVPEEYEISDTWLSFECRPPTYPRARVDDQGRPVRDSHGCPLFACDDDTEFAITAHDYTHGEHGLYWERQQEERAAQTHVDDAAADPDRYVGHDDDFKYVLVYWRKWPSWVGKSGEFLIGIHSWKVRRFFLVADLELNLTAAAKEAWRQKIWRAIYEGAQARFYERRQMLKEKLARLEEELGAQDALSLRKKEREEVMKGVLRWLLGKDIFRFYPEGLPADIEHELYETETGLVPDEFSRQEMLRQGQIIKFLHHAIEWENVLYFLYPYFWSHPNRWEFKKYIDHPDAMHRAFLKAGSARVVLTIRPGFEEAFLAFTQSGDMNQLPPSPYFEIGEEFKAFAETNYPGIPPANPERSVRPLLSVRQRRAWDDMQEIMKLLEGYRQANGDYPTTAQGLAVLPRQFVDPWGRAYAYTCPGEHADFDLVAFGADGAAGGEGEDADIESWAEASLIGTWYEYTPTSALDIAFDTAKPTA